MPVAPDTRNYYLGRGIVYFSDLDANDAVTGGELDLGNCKQFNLSLSADTLAHYNYRDGLKVKDKEVVVGLNAEGTIVLDEYNVQNLLFALYGTQGTLTQGSGSQVDESHTAYTDRWIPLTYRNVSSVTVTGYVEDTDFTVDTSVGRIYIISAANGGSIVDESTILVSYTYAAVSDETVRAFTVSTIEGFIRFVGDPQVGPIYEAEIWKCTLRPEGDLAMITDEWGEITLKISMQKMETAHPDEPYFRLIYKGVALGSDTTTTTTA